MNHHAANCNYTVLIPGTLEAKNCIPMMPIKIGDIIYLNTTFIAIDSARIVAYAELAAGSTVCVKKFTAKVFW